MTIFVNLLVDADIFWSFRDLLLVNSFLRWVIFVGILLVVKVL